MGQQIEHAGRVARVAGESVVVRIISVSACGTCKAREACGLAETQEKLVEVHTIHAASFAEGDAVTVGVRRGVGAVAVLLAYVGALVVLMSVLTISISVFGWTEAMGALASLGGVLLYYIVLWIVRKKIENTIHFTITKN